MRLLLLIPALMITLTMHPAAAEKLVYVGKPKLSGRLCKPDGPGPFPAVIYNHGGLGNIIGGDPKGTCEALKMAGYIGFSPMRRRTKSLKNHPEDVQAALEALRGVEGVDASRMAMVGFSRGGLLTLMTGNRDKRLKALVILATAAGGRGQLDVEKANLTLTAPVLLMVAENDTGSRSALGQNTKAGMLSLNEALKAAGKDVRLIVLPPHGGDGHQAFAKIGGYWTDVLEFLKQNL